MKKSKVKPLLSGAVTLAFTALVLTLVFRGQGEKVLQCLRAVPLRAIVPPVLLALGSTLLEAAAMRTAFRIHQPKLTFGQALTACYLNIFGNVATMGAGAIPLQSWFLSFCGMQPGVSIGLATLCYSMQKLSVLLYATVMLVLQGGWLSASNPSLSRYILLGYGICALIILALVLLCTWEKVQDLALWGIGKLPDSAQWAERKRVWGENIAALRSQSKELLRDRRRCLGIMLLYTGKLFLLYAVSASSIEALGLDPLSFWQIQLLSAVMLLITNALPNVSGVGPAEFAFTLIFSPYLGNAGAASAMVLYRAASYLLPLLVSIPFVFRFHRLVQRRKQPREPWG